MEKTVEEIVPSAFHAYLDVIRKELFERMPMRKPWDHAIDLMLDFVLEKSFPLSLDECEEMSSFVRDQLRKGYIRPSSSPLLEHTTTQRMNTLNGYRGLTENKKGWNGSLLIRAHTVVVETPRE